MKITIFGSGYVGLVTGACLAEVGNHVICVDIDADKIRMLSQGRIPIHEPGLEEMVQRNSRAGRLGFTTDLKAGVAHGRFQFIAVGSPPDNPEFLKEGAAIDDFMRPDRIIIGTDNPRTTELLHDLYAPFNRNHDRVIAVDIRSAELTKYAANAMLATKISFMNELANLAERLGADIEQVRVGIGADPRIGYHFIYPGCGYGGSCFPKDVKALERTARDGGYQAELLRAVEAVNERQKHLLFTKITRHFGPDLRGRTIAVWGLAFKPNTDDMREAPSRTLIEALWGAGARVRAHDPAAMTEALRIYGERDDLKLCETPQQALDQADALAIATEWNIFRSPDVAALKAALKEPVIFDGRNLYNPQAMEQEGFSYYAVGRGR
ncbi:MAG: UDP-glucose/GDP-mannose dehydrogenase family protein [Gammaproteobacteria bacterium]